MHEEYAEHQGTYEKTDAGNGATQMIPHSCLLVIDVQNGFVTGGTRPVIGRIAEMLARHPFEKVMGTSFVNWEESPWCHMGWRGCLTAEEQEIVPEIRRHILPGNIYRKRYYSAVSDSLVEDIRDSGIRTTYICGLDTDACVLATALDMFCEGFNIKVIGDCCASSSGIDAHEAGLTVIRHGIGEENVITMSDILGVSLERKDELGSRFLQAKSSA